MEILVQGRLIVVFAHPVEEWLAPLGVACVTMEERIKNTGSRVADMAKAQGELSEGFTRGASLEQHEQPGREACAVGT